MRQFDVIVEVGAKRSFACALWFPGWFGHGKTPEAALEQLLHYRNRYASIAARASQSLPSTNEPNVIERLAGNSTTDFGAPGQVAVAEESIDDSTLEVLRGLHAACRAAFIEVSAAAPEELRKGPRGGGRNTGAVIDHVETAEKAYLSKLRRAAWPEAYYLRRSGYHYADHIWEIEDRST